MSSHESLTELLDKINLARYSLRKVLEAYASRVF